ncbi:hypothetical protein BDF21DRAFT_418544 [Thamnidium elegans]|nr:hypothetical protein BDF21DRAFT_418544 [Thamnidium elegans]
MKSVYLLLIYITCIITQSLAISNTVVNSGQIQKLEKRGCDFHCQNQPRCDKTCEDLSYGAFLLGVCHRGKCFCGFMPNF